MKIYCPKCHTCYAVEIGLIPADGKKLRCNRCGEVWLCTHKDMDVPPSSPQSEPEANSAPQNVIANEKDEIIITPSPDSENEPPVDNDDINLIFARLKDEATKVSTEIENQSIIKKNYPKIKKFLGWNSRLVISLELLIAIIIACLAIFAERYDLVRRFPQAEAFFSQLGVPSKVIGEGLEFQNITRNFQTINGKERLSIKGFIHNTTSNELSIPTISVNILNQNANSIFQIKKETEFKTIAADDKQSFNLLIDVPPLDAKYILLTFTE